MEEIYFVSGNENKFEEAKKILGNDLNFLRMEIKEIQSEDIYEIVKEKAKIAYCAMKKPIIVEDAGFYLECLNGFPGPLVKNLISSVGPKGIYELVKNYKEKTCVVRCVLCYFDGEHFNFFTGDIKGKIVRPAGKNGFGFDPIFRPDGEKKTFGQISMEQKNKISHRNIAWNKFKEFLEK
jgi:non-canonical purine NTP pyrophosphatase (RdgB/HAM1 family)